MTPNDLVEGSVTSVYDFARESAQLVPEKMFNIYILKELYNFHIFYWHIFLV